MFKKIRRLLGLKKRRRLLYFKINTIKKRVSFFF